MDTLKEQGTVSVFLTKEEQEMAEGKEQMMEKDLSKAAAKQAHSSTVLQQSPQPEVAEQQQKPPPLLSYYETTIERFLGVDSCMKKLLNKIADSQEIHEVNFFLEVAGCIPLIAQGKTKKAVQNLIEIRDQIKDGKTNEANNLLLAMASCIKIQSYHNNSLLQMMKLHSQLMTLSGRSQADRSCGSYAHTDSSRKQPHSSMTSDPNPVIQKDFVNNMLPKTLSLGVVLEENPLTTFTNEEKSLHLLERCHQEVLSRFYQRFQNCLDVAKFLNALPIVVEALSKEKHKEAKEIAKKRYQKVLYELEAYLTSSEDKSLPTEIWLPGPMAEELDLVQPYLAVLLRSLGAMLLQSEHGPERSDEGVSPVKAHILNNRPIPSTVSRPKHTVDKSIVGNDSRFIYLLRDDGIQIPVEEKPGQRKHETPEALRAQAVNQVLSHLAKHVGVGFNFAAIGVDSRATGVVLTPAYVKLVQLRLENMGTEDAKLVQLGTKCLPLMSIDNFDRWCDDNKDKWDVIKSEMYPGGGVDSDVVMADCTISETKSGKKSVPSGLVALCNLMVSSRKDLFGNPTFESESVGDLIGYGYFAAVYTHKQNNNQVIKFSRYGSTGMLEYEAKVLGELNGEQNENVGIVRLHSICDEPVKIGGVVVHLKGLTLEPRGIPLEMHLVNLGSNERNEELKKFGQQLEKALEFVHYHGYVHLDISPKNMMVSTKKNNMTAQAFLIDFGIASKKCEAIVGFRGTVKYAHRSVFLQYPKKIWKANDEQDMTGLAFSMAELAAPRKHLWGTFQPFEQKQPLGEREQAFRKWANKRSEKAEASLKEVGFDKHWFGWCNDSKKMKN